MNGYALPMTPDTRQTLERIIAYCERNRARHQAEVTQTTVLPVGTTTGMKMAYTRVRQYVCTLIEQLP